MADFSWHVLDKPGNNFYMIRSGITVNGEEFSHDLTLTVLLRRQCGVGDHVVPCDLL